MNIEKDKTRFEGAVQFGNVNASEVLSILHGEATLDFPSATTGALASASAAVAGMVAGHRVFLTENAASEAAMGHVIKCVVAGAGSFTASAVNATSATKDQASTTFSYFAIR
jgi:hypothetical protein